MSNNKNRILFSHEQNTKVGIGTDTPGALLHLVTDQGSSTLPAIHMDSPDPTIVFNDTTNTGSMSIKWQAGTGNSQGLRFWRDGDSDANPNFMIDLNGNVGVKRVPSGGGHIALDIAGDARITSYMNTLGDVSQGLTFSPDIGDSSTPVASKQDDYTPGVIFGYGAGKSALVGLVDANDHDGMGLAFLTHPSGTGADDSVEAMRIERDGDVVIGTNRAGAQLHVNDSINGINSGLLISNYNTTAGTGQQTRLSFGLARNSGSLKPAAGEIRVGKEQDWTSDDATLDSYMSFHTFRDMDSHEQLRITSDGRVGIGTIIPEEKLHVDGKITSNVKTAWGTHDMGNGRVRFDSDSFKVTNRTDVNGYNAIYESYAWSDVNVRTQFTTQNETHVGIIVRANDSSPQDNNVAVIIRNNNTVRVQQRAAGVQTYLVAEVAIGGSVNIDDGGWHDVDIHLIDDEIFVNIDGRSVIKNRSLIIHSSIGDSGMVGVTTYEKAATTTFKNFTAKQLTAPHFLPEDTEVRKRLTITGKDTEQAILECIGTGSQGTGDVFVGQSRGFGGGLIYNGNDDPDRVNGSDDITLYRRNDGVDYSVMKWRHNTSDVRMDGALGVGMTNEAGMQLDVAGQGRIQNRLTINRVDDADGWWRQSSLYLRNAPGSTDPATGQKDYGVVFTNATDGLALHGTTVNVDVNTFTPHMTITPTGKVGIGTKSPQSSFTVANQESRFGIESAAGDTWNSTNPTRLVFQDHGDFWIGAGNGTWFTGAANTKTQASGLAADATYAHDLLLTTMKSTNAYDRGITFASTTAAAPPGGSSGTNTTEGYRLGKWHSGISQATSQLAIDGGLTVKGGNTDIYDYYGDDYSTYHDDAGAQSSWTGDPGWNRASILAADAIQIQSGNASNSTKNPQLQFHQHGYGGPMIRFDGPNDALYIEDTHANGSRFDQLIVKTTVGNTETPSLLTLRTERSDITTAAGVALQFVNNDGNNNPASISKIKSIANNESVTVGDSNESSSHLVFETANAGVLSDKVVITGAGNVGINTMIPVAPIHIKGWMQTPSGTGLNNNDTEMATMSQIGCTGVFEKRITFTRGTGSPTHYLHFGIRGTGSNHYKIKVLCDRHSNQSSAGQRDFGMIVDEGYVYWENDGDYGAIHHPGQSSSLGQLEMISKTNYLTRDTGTTYNGLEKTSGDADNNDYVWHIIRIGIKFSGVTTDANTLQEIHVIAELSRGMTESMPVPHVMLKNS